MATGQPSATPISARSVTSPDAEVRRARQSFIEMADRALPRGAQPLRQNQARPDGPPKTAQRAAQVRQATGQIHESATRITDQPPMSPPAPPARPDTKQAEPVPHEKRPDAVAAQAEAMRAPADNLTIPMAEASGHGPESQRALRELAGVEGERPDLMNLGTAIAEGIGTLRDRAVHNAEAASDTLRAEAAQQRAGVRSAVGSSRAEVDDVVRDTRGRVAVGAMGARSTIAQRGRAARTEATAIGEAESARLDNAVAEGGTAAEETFTAAGSNVREAGTAQSRRGREHANDLADQAIKLGHREAATQRREEEDQDLGRRKAEAVREVAQHYAEQLRDDGRILADDVIDQATEAVAQVTAEAEPAVEGVAKVSEGGVAGVQHLMTCVGEGVGSVERQGREQLAAAERGSLGEVRSMEQAVQGRAEALLARGEASLDAALAAGLASHAKLAGEASQMLDEAGRDAIAQLAVTAERAATSAVPLVSRQATEDADAGSGAHQSGDTRGGPSLQVLDQVGPVLDTSAAAQGTEMVESLRGATTAAGQGGSAWAEETRGMASRLGEITTGGLRQVAETAGSQADATVAEGATQARSEVDRVSGEVNRSVSDIQTSVDGGVIEAVGNLRGGTDEGIQHADATYGEIPGAMRTAAQAQESWWGRAGSWVSGQLSDTWKAIQGMADWRFWASALVGMAAAIAVGVGVALLIPLAPIALPGLAVLLLVGAAAGAAGFAAAQITGNLLDADPLTRWYDGVGHAAILGVFVGAAGGLATIPALSLFAGTLIVMGAAGVGTVVANLATGRPPSEHFLANVLIIGVLHGVIKGVRDRIPSRHSESRTGEKRITSDYEPPPKGRPVIVVDSPKRVAAGEMRRTATGWECDLLDRRTGAIYGDFEVKANRNGTPRGGPHMTIDPTNAVKPDGRGVRLQAEGFSWTVESLREVIKAFRAQFGRGPVDMGGLLAWKNLLNFQQAFARIRAANPGLAERVVAERAARDISFGKHRIRIGYGDISVQYGNMGDVALPDGTVLTNVPQWVEVGAKPTTAGALPTVPQDDEED